MPDGVFVSRRIRGGVVLALLSAAVCLLPDKSALAQVTEDVCADFNYTVPAAGTPVETYFYLDGVNGNQVGYEFIPNGSPAAALVTLNGGTPEILNTTTAGSATYTVPSDGSVVFYTVAMNGTLVVTCTGGSTPPPGGGGGGGPTTSGDVAGAIVDSVLSGKPLFEPIPEDPPKSVDVWDFDLEEDVKALREQRETERAIRQATEFYDKAIGYLGEQIETTKAVIKRKRAEIDEAQRFLTYDLNRGDIRAFEVLLPTFERMNGNIYGELLRSNGYAQVYLDSIRNIDRYDIERNERNGTPLVNRILLLPEDVDLAEFASFSIGAKNWEDDDRRRINRSVYQYKYRIDQLKSTSRIYGGFEEAKKDSFSVEVDIQKIHEQLEKDRATVRSFSLKLDRLEYYCKQWEAILARVTAERAAVARDIRQKRGGAPAQSNYASESSALDYADGVFAARFDGGVNGLGGTATARLSPRMTAFAESRLRFTNGASDSRQGVEGGIRAGISRVFTTRFSAGVYALAQFGDHQTSTSTLDSRIAGGGVFGRYRLSQEGAPIALNAGFGAMWEHGAHDFAMGGATGSFGSDRYSLQGQLSASTRVEEIDVSLAGNVDWSLLDRRGFTMSDATVVPGNRIETLGLSATLGLSRTIAVASGPVATLTPSLGATFGYVFTSEGGYAVDGQLFEFAGAHFDLGGGVVLGFFNGATLDLTASAKGLATDTRRYVVNGNLRIPLN